MQPRERDLRHDADPERFGDAMLKCQNASGECMSAGRCLYDGQCFVTSPEITAAEMIEGLLPHNVPAGQHWAYLRKCAEMLREGRVAL